MNVLQENCKACEKKRWIMRNLASQDFSSLISFAPLFFLDESADLVSLCPVFFEG
jgi:hypothetical protein